MPSKLDFLQKQPAATPAEQLRRTVTALEDQRATLRQANRAGVLAYLAGLDIAADLLTQLHQAGADVTSESLRVETLVKQLQKKAGPLLEKLSGRDGLRQARPSSAESNAHPWWFLDEFQAQRRAAIRKRAAVIGGVVAALLAVIVILFNTVLKPDPAIVAKTQHFQEAFDLAIVQDYPVAIAEIDAVLEILPNDVDARVFKAVLLQKTGDAAAAQKLLDEANSLAETDSAVPLAAARLWQQVGENRTAITLAEGVLEQYPDSAEAWFIAGQSHAALGETDAAREALSKAAELALAQGNDSLYVIAKTNLTYLLPGGK